MKGNDKNGKKYSPVYLKTLHNQLSAIFNHAVKFYGLKENPAAKVGNMGKARSREMLFWTEEEYQKFAFAIMDKPLSYYAFEMLYWCGIREGELLALTPADLDFERGTVTINKSYQRIDGRDVVTEPKTPKSNRVIKMPDFLVEEMKEYKYEYSGKIHSSVQFDYFPYPVADKAKLTNEIFFEIAPEAEEWELMRELSYLDVDADVLYRPFETLSNGEQTTMPTFYPALS